MPESIEDQLVTALADGEPIDWEAATREAPEARAFIDQLRLLEGLARLHRSIDDTDPAAESTREAPALPADVRGLSWGGYELREEIGKGSYGVVYRAHDPSLKRDLAIKLLHSSIGERRELTDRIYREGQALGRLHHPNVVVVYAVGSHAGRLGLCMELVRGRTLHEVVGGQGRLNAEEAAVLGQFVCRALNAVHSAGLVHRDVSAKNVMRDENGRIVLMDFGTGLDMTESALAARAAGTPLFMAPELFNGAPASRVTDLYSVGVLLYYLATKRFPVEGAAVADVAAAHRAGRAGRLVSEHRADLPDEFVRVVTKATARSPHERYQSAAELELSLAEIVASPLKPRAEKLPGWQRALAAGFAGLAMLAGLAFLGRLSTYAFNTALQLPPQFADQSWADALRWGAKSALAPLAVAAALVVLYSLCDGLLRSAWGTAVGDAIGRRVRWLSGVGRRIGLDSTSGAARLVVLGSVAAFLWVRFVRFPALIDAYTVLNAATPNQLWALSSANYTEQDAYRQTLSLLVWVVIGCWIGIIRRARARREFIALFTELAAVGTVMVPLLLLAMPYRLFLHAELERATYRSAACHVIDERAGSLLLLCPEQSSRPFPIELPSTELKRLGEVSNVFDALAASAR